MVLIYKACLKIYVIYVLINKASPDGKTAILVNHTGKAVVVYAFNINTREDF